MLFLIVSVLQDLLERSVSASVKNPAEAVYPLPEGTATDTQIKGIPVSSVQQKGIAMAVRYGQQLKLLSSGKLCGIKIYYTRTVP